MKYFKIILFLISFSSIANAEIIKNLSLLANKNYCITNDYYYDYNGAFNFYDVKKDKWRITTTKKYQQYIHDGFVYDTNRGDCYPDDYLILGLDIKDYAFLRALIGILAGFTFLFFMTYTFINITNSRR